MEKTTFDTSGQSVQKSPEGLFLQDGIEGLHSLPRHSVDMLLTDPPYGTTAVAAMNTHRRFICFENAPSIYTIAAQRIEQARLAMAGGGKGE